MSNRAVACLGIGAYVLSVLSSATDLDGNSIAPAPLLWVSAIACVTFVIWAPIRLWREAHIVALVFVFSTVMSVVCEVAQLITQPEYGSPIIVLTNINRVIWLAVNIAAIVKLFNTNPARGECLTVNKVS